MHGGKTVVDDGQIGTLPLPGGLKLETLKKEVDVKKAISTFLQDDAALCKSVLLKLESIEKGLERSHVFNKYCLLRSHLLLTYDDANREAKCELKMINFGASYEVPNRGTVDHSKGWDGQAASHEDGYMTGIQSLHRVLKDLADELAAKK